MSTLLQVLRFDSNRLTSECKVIESDDKNFHVGQQIHVDLTVCGDFNEMRESDLVGKVVEVQNFQPYEYIAYGCSIRYEP